MWGLSMRQENAVAYRDRAGLQKDSLSIPRQYKPSMNNLKKSGQGQVKVELWPQRKITVFNKSIC